MSRRMAILAIACATLMSALLALPSTVVAQPVEIIRGTVVSDSGARVVGAAIIVTRAPDRATFVAVSDSNGRYVVTVAQGTGDYLVHISAAGFVALRKRATRAERATGVAPADTTFVVDAILARAVAQQLAVVTVQAAKAVPTRFRDAGTRAGAAEAFVDDFAGGIPPDQAGNLGAALATLPGVSTSSAGPAVLGIDPSQNITMLNGMAFSGSTIPRALQTSTRVSTSSYDPAKGWFGGAATNVEFSGASVFRIRSLYATVDAPPLQATDAVARGLGLRYSGGAGSIGASGPIDRRDQFFFNSALQFGRRMSEPASLFTASPLLLSRAGISADSVTRLRSILRNIGLPTGDDGVSSRTTDDVSLVVRLDHDPRSVQSDKPATRTQAVTLFGNWSRSSPMSLRVPSSTLGTTERSASTLGVQGLFSTYFGRDYLGTVRSALSVSTVRTRPDALLPSASVLLASSLPGDDAAIATLGVGGGAPASTTRHYTWETIGETQMYVHGLETHRVTLTADARLDGYSLDGSGADRASFAFNSLADLAAGIPTSYRRVSGTPQRAGGVWNSFASVGDLWRVSRTVRVEYGARIEANAYTVTPAANPQLQSLLDVRTDVAPNRWHASPRIGFTWTRRGGGNAGGLAINSFGSFNMRPTSYIRGGIGEFRSIMPAELLSDALVTASGTRATVLSCVGAAAPPPDWRAYLASEAAFPSACVGGAATSPLSDTAPVVRTVNARYTAPRSWRANLGYESRYRWLVYSVEGTLSLNLNQTGRTDLNFAGRPIFRLGDDQRPVFVPASSIVASSGAVSPQLARITPTFGSVFSTHSDLRSVSKQLIVSLSPGHDVSDRAWVHLAYVLGQTRSWQGGYEATTAASPLEREWTRGSLDTRHQLLVRSGVELGKVSLTLFARISSGLPYTPLVGSDINGDGVINDRAIIPANAVGASSSLRRQVNELIASSAPARACLGPQRGATAAPLSCTGPWNASLNAQVSAAPTFLKVGGRQPYIHLNLANPLSGLDQLLHGSEKLRGWGTPAVADPTLLLVRGFDPSSRTFLYDVNPRFGSSAATRSIVRAPFRVTLDVRFNLSPDFPTQQLKRYLGPGRHGRPGARLTVAQLQQRYAREVSDPYASILVLNDSLLLSRTQVDGLQQAQRKYRAVIDSVWRDLATAFASLEDDFDASEAVARQERTIEDARELTRLDVRATLGTLLDAQQLRLIPAGVLRMYRAERPLTRDGRTFYSR